MPLMQYLWDTTTIPGLSKVKSAPYLFLKIVWCIVYAVFVYFTVSHIHSSVVKYFTFPLKTLTSVGYDALPYPSISICNLNPMIFHNLNLSTCRLMKQNGITEEHLPEFCRRLNHVDTFSPIVNEKAIFCAADDKECNKMVSYVLSNSETIRYEKNKNKLHSEIIKRYRLLNVLGFDMGHFVWSCYLYGSKCKKSQITNFSSSEYGRCVTVNPDETMKVASASGPDRGYKIVLFLDEYLNQYSQSKGYKVVIHEPNTIPMPSVQGIVLSGGEEANIALQVSYNSFIGRDWGDVCYDGQDFEQIYKHRYTEEACRITCLGNITKRYCGCYPTIVSDVYREDIISEICSEEKVTCEKIVEALMLRNRSLLHSCNFGGCPRPCKSISYKPHVATRGWPSMYYTSALWKQSLNCDLSKWNGTAKCNVNESNFRDFRESWARLNVYFETLSYRNITESLELNFLEFLAQLGGTASLFVGLSCITLFEILEVIFLFMMKSCRGITRPSKKKHKKKISGRTQLNTIPFIKNEFDTTQLNANFSNTTECM